MVAELERRAAEAGPTESGEPMTAIDVVCELISEGGEEGTLANIARDLTGAIGQTISPGTLSSWLNSTSEGKAKVAAARALAAHVLAEDSLDVLDQLNGTEVTREEIQLAKARSETRQWLASKWNRPQYGADAAQVNVQVNVPGQHLAVMRRRAIAAKAQQQLPPAGPDYETVPHGE